MSVTYIYKHNTAPIVFPYHADLSNTRHNEPVDEVILSAHFTEEEVDFFLIRNESGADEGWICSKHSTKTARFEWK